MSSYLTVITLHSCSLTLTLTLTLVELTLTQVLQSDDVPAQSSAPHCLPCTLQPTLTVCTVCTPLYTSVQ